MESAQKLQAKLFKRLGLDPDPNLRRYRRGGRTQGRRDRAGSKGTGPTEEGPSETPNRELPTASTVVASSSLKRKRQVEGEALQSQPKTTSIANNRLVGPETAGGYQNSHSVPEHSAHSHKLTRRAPDTLSREDARIAELERRLGIKGGKPGGFPASPVDGWDELLGNTEEPDHDVSEYAEWLATKRIGEKSNMGPPKDTNNENTDVGESSSTLLPEVNLQTRENPYMAPMPDSMPRYVPPSRRIPMDDHVGDRLRKQIQGQVNRLTEDNMLSIVHSIEGMYRKNARGDVTTTLVDILMAQICKPEVLPDPFFVLTGGFVSAVYQVVGASFGSQLLMRTMTTLRAELDRAHHTPSAPIGWNKESSNLAAFLATLYVFEVVGHSLIYEFLQLLLSDLSELSAEIILRIIRLAGRLLRRDDPMALKDAVSMLNKSVATAGSNMVSSARAKYMIEAINDLKDNKAKSAGGGSALVSEHVQRMRKRLGELKAQSWRRLDGTTALGLSLRDIEKADVEGRWWLVGASVPVKESGPASKLRRTTLEGDAVVNSLPDEEDIDLLLPDYRSRAREQGLSTSAQLSIFTAVMSAADAAHGFQQFLALGLNANERREIAHVLVQCAGSEATYNPYYALVARQACSSNTKIRFAFQDRLWGMFRKLGEPLFEDDNAEGSRDSADTGVEDERVLKNVGTLFGALIFDSALSITILKPLNLHDLLGPTQLLIEQILATVIRACARVGGAAKRRAVVERAFGAARELATLSAGLHYLLGNIGGDPALQGKVSGLRVHKTLTAAQEVLVQPPALS